MRMNLPLSGLRVLSLAVNVPGPVAAARLRSLGATVLKVEPPAGDPLAEVSPAWYRALHEGVEVTMLDLKSADGRERLEPMLADADLLVTATRPAGLARLGLGWDALHARHPRLCHLAVVGYPPPDADRAGHDLTYQASAGLVAPPGLPRTLLADLAAGERAVSAALALLLLRERGGEAGQAVVSLSEAADSVAEPLRHGITAPGGVLGGALSTYALYRAADGWIALAALEPHFLSRLLAELGLKDADRDAFERVFPARTAAEWERWADERDLPIAAVREPGTTG